MHELSVALSLVEAASEKAAALGNVPVVALHVRLGPLSGVVREALLFSFDLAAEGTPVAGARLVVEDVPIAAVCAACGEQEIASAQSLRCPVCAEPVFEVVRGRELELRALEVAEHDAAHP